ncbi:hypothetical protein ABK040_009288 [Willaertia magna]
MLSLETDCLFIIFQYLSNNAIVNLRLINNRWNELITIEFSNHWNKVIEPILIENPDILGYYKTEFHKQQKHYLLSVTSNWNDFKNNYLPFIMYLDSINLTTFKKSFYLIYLQYLYREYDYGYDFRYPNHIEIHGCYVKKKRALFRLWKAKKELESRDWDRIEEVSYIELKNLEVSFKNLKEIPRKGVKKVKEIEVTRVGDLAKYDLKIFHYYNVNKYNETKIFTTLRY